MAKPEDKNPKPNKGVDESSEAPQGPKQDPKQDPKQEHDQGRGSDPMENLSIVAPSKKTWAKSGLPGKPVEYEVANFPDDVVSASLQDKVRFYHAPDVEELLVRGEARLEAAGVDFIVVNPRERAQRAKEKREKQEREKRA